MNTAAAIANSLWVASSVAAARRFARALSLPRETQERWLRAQLARHATSEFGQQHDFASLHGASDYTNRVPLADYDKFEPWVHRIAAGERDILGCGRVTHLAPTSGSSGAAKLIPFTASLQKGFNAAVSAWMVDLVRQRPTLISGPAYWSISPLSDPPPLPSHQSPVTSHELFVPTHDARVTNHEVAVGFADDAEYVGGAATWLVRRALAVPADLRHVHDVTAFWRLTLLALLRCRDLRLISIWHPSFIELLLAEAEPAWPALLDAIASGSCPWESHLPGPAWRAAPDPNRASELRRIGAADWPRWWPHLQVLSCWGEQAAESGWRRLAAQLPNSLVQPKGLLATEAVVTIPWHGVTPLAVTSHYFEFIDRNDSIRGAHELERGQTYEVVVTNGGGLWRYRLGDTVECTGHAHLTPSLRFLGRAGHVSDLRGEKVSEAFVQRVLRDLWMNDVTPAYSAFRASDSDGRVGYELLVSSDWQELPDDQLAARAETALAANPHYALARRLGQLAPLRVVQVESDTARQELRSTRGRLGDAKPSVLIGLGD